MQDGGQKIARRLRNMKHRVKKKPFNTNPRADWLKNKEIKSQRKKIEPHGDE